MIRIMKIEKLRKSHKKEIIIGTILTVVIGGALTFKLTHSKYRVTQSIDLGSGVINYKVPDFKIMAMYKNDGSGDVSIDSMPTSEYVINEEKTYCQTSSGNQVKGKIKTINGNHVISGLNKGDKCYLYFDISAAGIILVNLGTNIKTANPDFSQIATTNEGVYSTSDGMYTGTTYYWRGAVENNHVIFANKCWRIVRINGDKTIRLIYNGDIQSENTCIGNGVNSTAVIMGSNNAEKYYATRSGDYNNPSYVGWTYILNSQRTLEGIDSNAKVQTTKWYNNNVGNNETYNSLVANGKYCNDRDVYLEQNFANWNTSQLYYAGYNRLRTNHQPTFNCPSGDVYTLKVGLITADEVVFAGGAFNNSNDKYYMYMGQNYWTMTPDWWNSSANVLYVRSDGYLDYTGTNSYEPGLRPVINLKSDTQFSSGGQGTANSPYVVVQ